MSRIRLLLPLLLLLPLASCFSGQQKQLASCEADAASAFPRAVPGQPFKAIQACMEKAGYRFIGWNDGVVCDMNSLVRGTLSNKGGDVLCFEPAGWLERKLYRLEVPEKSQTASSS